jgi:hypothetical protein
LSARDKFSLKVSVELSSAKSLIKAQNLKVARKSGRCRVVDSPPLTLQTIVVVWSSNIAYNSLLNEYNLKNVCYCILYYPFFIGSKIAFFAVDSVTFQCAFTKRFYIGEGGDFVHQNYLPLLNRQFLVGADCCCPFCPLFL